MPARVRQQLGELAHRASLPEPEVVEGEPLGYRHRARLMVRGRGASPKIGIFQSHSHRIVDIPDCRVHHPLINRVIRELKRSIRATGTTPYADAPHRGDLRSVQVAVERSSQQIQLVVVGNARDSSPLQPLISALMESLTDVLHSLWWNGNCERTNVILGPDWERLLGPETLCETIGGASIHFPPGAFGQANLPLADRIVDRIASWVPDRARVLEFYAGCGAIGLGLASHARSLILNEVSPHSLIGLERGVEGLKPTACETTLVPGPARDHVDRLRDAEIVIADPPRKGLDPELIEALRRDPPNRFIYLSCGVDSLLRDVEALAEQPELRLAKIEIYALFPQTEHAETLLLFERSQ